MPPSNPRDVLRERDPLTDDTRCSYCRIPLWFFGLGGLGLEAEHILPRNKFPNLIWDETNLVWACPRCNSKKGDRTRGEDPLTGRMRALFHPRRQRWAVHFSGNRDGFVLSKTATARSTDTVIKFNEESSVIRHRRVAADMRLWPS